MDKQSKNEFGVTNNELFEMVNELLPSLSHEFTPITTTSEKSFEEVYKKMILLSYWSNILVQTNGEVHSRFPFSVKKPSRVTTASNTVFPFSGMTTNEGSMRRFPASFHTNPLFASSLAHLDTKSFNIIEPSKILDRSQIHDKKSAFTQITICLYELCLFKRQIANYITGTGKGMGHVCDELIKYIPYYSVPGRNANSDKQEILCGVLLIIGFLNRLLQMSNTCILLIKGGKSIQFFANSSSYDIDIVIIPVSHDNPLSDEKINEIGQMVVKFIFWIIPDSAEKLVYFATNQKESGILKISFKVEGKTEMKEALSEESKKPSLKITGKDGKIIDYSRPKEPVIFTESIDSFLDIGCGYNYAPGYVKYLYSMYHMVITSDSPYFFSHLSLVNIIKEKLYLLIDYLKYIGYRHHTVYDKNVARGNDFFRNKIYKSLTKLLPLLDSEKVSLVFCLKEILRGFETAKDNKFIASDDDNAESTRSLLERLLSQIPEGATNQEVLNIITLNIYIKKYKVLNEKDKVLNNKDTVRSKEGVLDFASISLFREGTKYKDPGDIDYNSLDVKTFGEIWNTITPVILTEKEKSKL
jgi:hypothetical protein